MKKLKLFYQSQEVTIQSGAGIQADIKTCQII